MTKWHVLIFSILFFGASQARSEDILYKVVKKNSLSIISKKFYGRLDCWGIIFKANPHIKNPNIIYAGRELLIPEIDECRIENDTENSFIKENAQVRGGERKGTVVFKIFKKDEVVKNSEIKTEDKVVKINNKQADLLGTALDYYRKGLYPKAFELLKIRNYPKDMSPIVHYWRGLCLAKMQRYPRAIKNLVIAKEKGVKATDIDYEIGQAYYSNINYDSAVGYFKASIVKNFKVLLSIYHIAFIHQLLDEYEASEKFYLKLSKENNVSDKLKQIAIFEAAEMNYQARRSEKNIAKIVEYETLPRMEEALEVDDSTNYYIKIKARIYQLKDKYDLHPKPITLANGRKLPRKRWALKIGQSSGKDSNVLFEADGATSQVANKGSLFTRVFASGRYTAVPLSNKRVTLTPSLRLNKIHHYERNLVEIKKNDSHSIKGSLEGTYEGNIKSKSISTLLGGAYEYTAKDINGNEDIQEYGTSTSFWVGLKGKVFGKGNSSVKFRIRNFKGHRSGLDSDKTTLILSHFHSFSKSRYLYTYSDFTFTDSNLNSSTTDKYLLAADHVFSNFYKKLSFWTSGSFALIEPKLQKLTRGTEKEISLTVKLARTFYQNIDVGLKFNYLKNMSEDKTLYEYSKNTSSLELSYKF
ncbi:MAG: hypothetical protein CME70_03780 [Halobacteriovorax sp.]|nr:hypothetical protein [Halobacteriovorax sp.]|tara:strand:+ start:169574 stop:171496 length:1923 start_codon:yes stop_codon:yes gene_type:complete